MCSYYSKPQEPARLIECLPNSVRSTASSGNQGEDMSEKLVSPANGKDSKGLDAIGSLITPSIIPQLHELAQRMVAAGHHQECCKIYRYSTHCLIPEIMRHMCKTLFVFS